MNSRASVNKAIRTCERKIKGIEKRLAHKKKAEHAAAQKVKHEEGELHQEKSRCSQLKSLLATFPHAPSRKKRAKKSRAKKHKR